MDLRKFSIRTYVHKKRAYIINFEDKAPTIKNLYRIKQNKKKIYSTCLNFFEQINSKTWQPGREIFKNQQLIKKKRNIYSLTRYISLRPPDQVLTTVQI